MPKGFDTDSNFFAECGCLVAAGMEFAGVYINRQSPATIHHAVQQGLFIVSIFEQKSNTYSYFTTAQGLADGKAIMRFAPYVGQPDDTPIYCAVDFDCSEEEARGGIAAYFTALRSVINESGQGPFELGCYGSGLVLSVLRELGLVEYFWLADAVDWRGSSTFTGWHIKQSVGGVVCGVEVDYDESTGNAGGWRDDASVKGPASPRRAQQPG
jgi:hypothetical protein